MAWLLWIPSALAARALLFAPEGDPLPGVAAPLTVVAWGEDGPLEQRPELHYGDELIPLSDERPGEWLARWRPPPDADGRQRFSLWLASGERVPLELTLGEARGSGLRGPDRVEGVAGGGAVRWTLRGEELPAPEDLLLYSPEGQLVEVREEDGGLVVIWAPADSREPRSVPVGVRDAGRPESPPAWTVVSLVGRPELEVSTEPGARVTLRVGERSYGPEIAGEDGVATLRPEIWPGEVTGQAELVDDLGNVQRVPITLAGPPRPSLAAAAGGGIAPGRPPPPVFLFAVGPAGNPWGGHSPTCRSAAGPVEVSPAGAGRWIAGLPPVEPGALLDLRVDCSLGAAAASARLPVGSGRPERLTLQVYPEELSADFPVARVQVYLEDARGDRLPPDGVTLTADRGRMEGVEREGVTLRGEYLGDAVGQVDRVRATWSPPVVEGRPWALVAGSPDGGETLLVRAVDRFGRALAGAPVSVRLGGEEQALETDAGGWLSLPLAPVSDPDVVELVSGEVAARLALLPWAPPPALDPAAAALEASRELRLRAGRVREVRITAEPAVLYTGAGATASILVSLLDRSGIPVSDEPVTIAASDGEVSPARQLSDGSLEAIYVPPPGYSYGSVVVTAAGEGGAFTATTALELRPFPLRRGVAVSAGYITNIGEISAPWFGLDLDWTIPGLPEGFVARASVSAWSDRGSVYDAAVGETSDFRLANLSFSPALAWRRELGLWAVWGGGGLAVTPYRLEWRFGSDDPFSGVGLHRPGGAAFVGLARRVAGGELEGELRGISQQGMLEAVGYDGQIGGVALSVGYRVLY